jgi:hypothetical protein
VVLFGIIFECIGLEEKFDVFGIKGFVTDGETGFSFFVWVVEEGDGEGEIL